jgi:hypothetical protein
MNGVTHLEEGDSEFVEVDPTGRYGRVYISSSHIFNFSLSWFWLFQFDDFFLFFQYNEILGKGASKTVYV